MSLLYSDSFVVVILHVDFVFLGVFFVALVGFRWVVLVVVFVSFSRFCLGRFSGCLCVEFLVFLGNRPRGRPRGLIGSVVSLEKISLCRFVGFRWVV